MGSIYFVVSLVPGSKRRFTLQLSFSAELDSLSFLNRGKTKPSRARLWQSNFSFRGGLIRETCLDLETFKGGGVFSTSSQSRYTVKTSFCSNPETCFENLVSGSSPINVEMVPFLAPSLSRSTEGSAAHFIPFRSVREVWIRPLLEALPYPSSRTSP